MADDERGQVSNTAALVYDEFFVPALFAQWTDPVIHEAGIEPGQRVLDVACGTGVLTRAVADVVGSSGGVVGLDANEGMLEVARRSRDGIDWRLGRAETLPFADASFDGVVSQFGLMFFEDRAAALGEMWRVLTVGGKATVAVWASIERSPGYLALQRLLDRLFGRAAAQALGFPFAVGEPFALEKLIATVGFEDVRASPYTGKARFPSLESWMFTEIRGWTLADSIDDAGFDRILTAARLDLADFVQPDGTVEFDVEALIGVGRRDET
jgi:ubiquinone/menaquinone biosynthesis C-methylase UbiE